MKLGIKYFSTTIGGPLAAQRWGYEVSMRTFAVLLALLVSVPLAAEEDSQDSDAPALEFEERLGSALAEKVKARDNFNLRRFQNGREVLSALTPQLCQGVRYRAYRVSIDDADRIYYIASISARGGVVIGRHFSIPVVGGKGDVSAIEPSSNGCVILQKPPPDPEKDLVAMFITHVRSPNPTEFHVFAALMSDIGLYVGSETGTWSVLDGKLTLVRRRDP